MDLDKDPLIAPHLDQEALARLCSIMTPEQFEHIVALFLQGSKERMLALHQAIAGQDLASAEALLHSLKGSSANLGALAFSQCCDALMSALRQAPLSTLDQERLLFLEHELVHLGDLLCYRELASP